MSPQLLVAALTVTALSAGTAQAAAPPTEALTPRGTAQVPADVSARDCIQGGGMIVIAASGDGTNTFTKRCQGGVHDGQTIV